MKKVDKILFVFAIVILIFAIIFFPKARIRFSNTEIVFLQWWKNELTNNALEKIVNEYEAENYGVKILLETKTKKAVKDALFSFMQEQNEEQIKEEKKTKETTRLPDIIAIDTLWFDDVSKADFFEALPEYGEDIAADKTATVLSFINPLYYNITMLLDAGIDRPVKTQTDFLNICRKLKEKKYFGYSMSDDYFEEMFPWFAISDDTEFDFTSKNFISVLELFDTLQEELLVHINAEKDADKNIFDFCEGKTAMMSAPYYTIDKIKTRNPKINFNVTTIPYYGDYPPETFFVSTNWNIAVPTSAKHKEDIAKFVTFLMNNKQKLLEHKTTLEGKGSADNTAADLSKSEDPVYAKMKSFESGRTITVSDVFKRSAGIKTIFNEEVGIMLKTKRSAKETAQIIKKRYDEEQ
ncbi:MAG: sugar ABC transporter substrate-binding protein [Termitinemataceae bacterium]|nr:MAG: sugar ABC transporter substrate-binding protein [Termitinemataceae bacterium]